MSSHTAGKDLTNSLANAPHGENVFSRYPHIGSLKPDEQEGETFLRTLKRLAPHPIFSLIFLRIVYRPYP